MTRLLPDRVSCLCLLSGLLLALSFPRPDLAPLAWVALVPLFRVMDRRPFRSGFTAGAAFFALVLYWLNIVMTTYGKMHPFFSVVAYLLLVGYLALFFGVATWAAVRLREKSQLPPAVTLPVLWTALEFLRSFLFSGFPWATLGYSQQGWLAMIQSADLFGVYGTSFLLVLANAVLADLFGRWRLSPSRPGGWKAPACALLLLLLNLGYGHLRLGEELDARPEMLPTLLVQGNIDQAVKWDPAYKRSTLETYRRLSRRAGEGRPELIVWPESATPFYFQEGKAESMEVRGVARRADAFLLFGSPAYETVNRDYRFLNSAYLLDPSGEILGRSDKVHLVPFGEYVPLKPFLPFLDKLVTGIGDFAPGTISPLPMNGAEIGVLVCYEAIFPELAREWVRRGSDLLVNITNDAWFGRSSAPYQHLAMTRFRAIENRVWIARAANTGISAFIAPSGRITARTPIFEEAALRGEVGLGAEQTIYTRIGDVIPGLLLAMSVWWMVGTRRRRGKVSTATEG